MSIKSLRFGLNLYRKCYGLSQVRFFAAGAASAQRKYPTMRQLAEELAEVMGVEAGYKAVPKSRESLQALIPESIEELPLRTMRDSYTIGIIPLATDALLQEKYVGLTGEVRFSRFLEDMDLFSVVVAQKYLLNPRVKPGMHSPYTIVTALVDRIEFTGYKPKLLADVRISGHVSWVGRSSIEIIVWLDQETNQGLQRIIKACFLLACRDAVNNKSAIVNPLKVESVEEKTIVSGGIQRKKNRLNIVKADVTLELPNTDELLLVHDLYRRSRSTHDHTKTILPSGSKWMDECTLSTLIHAFPQHRNLHNTVFGGFLMRSATQLSYTLGLLFSRFRPMLMSISNIQFRYPVHMTALLSMHACVVYTEANFMQILVKADTWEIAKDFRVMTNSFHFTYRVPDTVPEMFPQTYVESMRLIDGRRHFIRATQTENSDSIEPITTFGEPKYSSLKENK